MTTQDQLTRINALLNNPGIDALGKNELEKFAQELTAQLRREIATSTHKVKPTETITRMLKTVIQNRNSNRATQGAWLDENGRQCTCDGFRAFRLKEALPLPVLAPDVKPLEISKIFEPALQESTVSLPLPSKDELKTFIALDRASNGRKKAPLYDFGDGLPAVNALYLLDLLNVLPDAKAYIGAEMDSIVNPIYAIGATGDALLLPVRVEGKMGAVDAWKKHRKAMQEVGINPAASARDNTVDLSAFARCFAAA